MDLMNTPFEPKRRILAANMWPIWHFGDTNKRYQSFLARGRPEFNGLIDQILLYDEIVIPTDDFLSLTVLIGVLGEKAVLDLLSTKSLKFTRLKGAFAYIGNGGGIQDIERIGGPEKADENPVTADIEFSVNWAINGLIFKPTDPNLAKKILENTIEINPKTILDIVKDETYKDVKSNEELQNYFALRNKDLNNLAGIDPTGVRIYGGLDSETLTPPDEIDTYLMLNNTNLELKLMELSGCMDMTTSNPIGRVLKAKFARQKTQAQNSLITLKEIADIPDFGEAVLQKRIEFKEILKIKESKNGEEFRNWFHNNCNGDDKSIAKEYIKILQGTPKISSLPARILRFIVTSGVGFIPGIGPLLGPSIGLLDSFFIEKWGHGASPKFFINDLKQIVK
jgi:hypothetical protein